MPLHPPLKFTAPMNQNSGRQTNKGAAGNASEMLDESSRQLWHLIQAPDLARNFQDRSFEPNCAVDSARFRTGPHM